MKPAVFLDRDGVINKTLLKMGKARAPYSLEEFSFIEGVTEALPIIKAKGYLTIVVTNQPDVSRGWVGLDQVVAVNNHVQAVLEVDDIYNCFHDTKDHCDCRKPKPGMLLEAAKDWDIALKKSYMVGDRLSDIEAGQAAGCFSVLVGPGDGAPSTATPDLICADLLELAKWLP